MREFYKERPLGGMSPASFTELINAKVEEFGFPPKFKITEEEAQSFAEMGFAKTPEGYGDLLFTLGDIPELERVGVLPEGFFKRFKEPRKKRR